MSRATRLIANPLSKDAARLLALLAEDGAFAALLEAEAKQLAVFARRRDVSVRIGSAPSSAAQGLVRSGLARPDCSGSRERFEITPEGRAAARRLAADKAGAPFLAQHLDLSRPAEPTAPQIDQSESPLAWLARRRDKSGAPLIGPHEAEAGERLRRDATMAQIMPSITANWSAAVSSGRRGERGLEATEAMVAARQRVTRAMACMGPDFAGLLMDVCVFLKGLELVETERGWPARSGKIVLRLALSQLARHYGLSAEARSDFSPLRSWGAADYRPRIDGPIQP